MANAQTVTALADLHDAIVRAIRGQFPTLRTVEAYREDRKSLPTPACLVELSEKEAEDGLDPGTGQLAVKARFEARLILGFRQEGCPKLAVRRLAAALAVFVHQQL